jgi:hypothetical protein
MLELYKRLQLFDLRSLCISGGSQQFTVGSQGKVIWENDMVDN